MSEQAAPYRSRRQNGAPPDPYMFAGQAFEIETQYRNCAEILFSAIMREPHNFATLASRMHPVWWEDTQYKKAAQAVWAQYYGPSRSYSVPSVCQAAGIGEVATPGGLTVNGVYAVMNAHIETDTALALEMFEPVYRQWVEHRCSLFVGSGIAQCMDAEQIRAQQDAFRNERRAYITKGKDPENRYLNWLQVKLSGQEVDYPCKPSLETMRTFRYKIAYEPGEYIIAAGRPSMGKTHWLLNELDHFAKCGIRGIFISADMELLKIQKRLTGQKTGINPKGDWSMLSDHDYQQVQKTGEEIDNWPIVIIDDVVDINEIVSICHAENYKERIHFLAIDYIQLLSVGSDKKAKYDENAELTLISKKLKHLSKVLKIPVIALSQLNRSVEARGGAKRPMLSDLRGSGSIEQDASTIMFFYRWEYYHIEELEDGTKTKGLGEIIFEKQQEDETGCLRCRFSGVTGWSDLPPKEFGHDQGQTIERPTYTDYNIPASARTKNDENIPF